MKHFDVQSYVLGIVSGLLVVVMAITMIMGFSRDVGRLRHADQYRRQAAIEQLQRIGAQLDMSAADVWRQLQSGKTLPQLFEEHARAVQESAQQEQVLGEGAGEQSSALQEPGPEAGASIDALGTAAESPEVPVLPPTTPAGS